VLAENKPSSVIKAKVSSEPSENEQCAPRRFFSSILGGEKPYARHITFEDRNASDPVVVKRQIDAAKFPISKKIAAALKGAAAAAPKCQQVSVIQRTPSLTEKIAKVSLKYKLNNNKLAKGPDSCGFAMK